MIAIKWSRDTRASRASSVIRIGEPDADVTHGNRGSTVEQECFVAEDTGVVRCSIALRVGVDFALIPREAERTSVVLGDKYGEGVVGRQSEDFQMQVLNRTQVVDGH